MRRAHRSGGSARRRARALSRPAAQWAALGMVLSAACGVSAARGEAPCNRTLGPTTVQAFIDHPSGLLESAVMNDPAVLGDRVRRLAYHGDAAIGAVSRIISLAREDQRKAMAAGLAQAATECRVVNPAVSRSVQAAASRVSDTAFRAAFFEKMQEGEAPPPPPIDNLRSGAASEGRTLPRLAPGSTTDVPPLNDPFKPLDPVKLR